MKIHSFSRFLEESKNPCWDGYKQIGTKKKNGKTVPRCVPVKESDGEKSYTFDELSPEAKKHAIDSNRDYSTEGYDWWDPIIEGFTEEMEEIGMTDIDCQFSGFNSQGDGASFTGKVNDNQLFLSSLGLNPLENLSKGRVVSANITNALNDLAENIYITIRRNDNRHYHHNTISAEVEVDGDDEIEVDLGIGVDLTIDVQEQCDKLEPSITEWAREKSKELYNSLETYYEELSSDETISSDLEAGGHSFDEEGNMI